MHVKNTLVKKKFKLILENWKESNINFNKTKEILKNNILIVSKKERNLIAGLLVKKFKK